MIVFDHVSKVYPNGTVGLDDVNLTIRDGEFVAIIGRSGARSSVESVLSIASVLIPEEDVHPTVCWERGE